MNSDPAKKNILKLFSPSSKKDWTKIAKGELDNADPFEKLSISKEDLTIHPYYDESDVTNTPFQLPVSSIQYKGNRAWENLSIVHTKNPLTANKEAIDALQAGADGILFDIEKNPFSEKIIKNIQWQYCSLRFLSEASQKDFLTTLLEAAQSQNLNPTELNGSVFWKSLPADVSMLIHSFKEFKNFQCLGICLKENVAKSNMIATALAEAVHIMDESIKENISPAIAANKISFFVPIETDFFIEIATLKTLRKLWYQILNAYDPSINSSVHIHAHSTKFVSSQFQPHANLIKSSTASLAAIAGGCDSLSIETEDYKNATLARIARNVSSIILDESHFDLVADPISGSYYLENLINELSKNSWRIFQEMTSA